MLKQQWSIGILTNPLESSFESSKRVMIVTILEIQEYTLVV